MANLLNRNIGEMDDEELLRYVHELRATSTDLLSALEGVMANVAGCEKDSKYETARAVVAKVKGAPAHKTRPTA